MMKNTIGNQIHVTLFGESHGPAIGAVIDGLAPGIAVDEEFIRSQLAKRRPAGKISTARVEQDEFSILSGVFNGYTTGTPICITIPNTAQNSKDYGKTRALARPGHADYTAYCKYHGFEDYRGGGHFSGRVTAALVAAGALLIPALEKKGIQIETRIVRCGGAEGDMDAIRAAIEKAAAEGDSVGGLIETSISGLPAGLGEPWFDNMESLLSHALFSIPAVKGVAFGEGFGLVDMKGSEANDPFAMEEGRIVTTKNNNGGINGGISNGMPVLIQTAIKPTPSIYKTQKTVDFMEKKDADLQIEGRHDPCIVHRACVVADSLCAMVIADLLAGRYGTDYLGEDQ